MNQENPSLHRLVTMIGSGVFIMLLLGIIFKPQTIVEFFNLKIAFGTNNSSVDSKKAKKLAEDYFNVWRERRIDKMSDLLAINFQSSNQKPSKKTTKQFDSLNEFIYGNSESRGKKFLFDKYHKIEIEINGKPKESANQDGSLDLTYDMKYKLYEMKDSNEPVYESIGTNKFEFRNINSQLMITRELFICSQSTTNCN